MTRDLVNNVKVTQVAIAATKTGTVTSDPVGMAGYNSLMFIYDIGNSADSLSGSLLWTLSLVECDTSGGNYTAVAAADILGWNGAATYVIDAPTEASLAVKVGYIGNKPFVKALATVTGSHSSGTPMGIVAVQGEARHNPVA